MVATVRINETNGTSPGTETTGITNSNYGSSDAANLTATSAPISVPASGYNYSYEKWQQLEVVSMGGASEIKNIKVWRSSGTPTGSDTHKGNQHETQATYDTTKQTTYSTPVNTASTIAVNTIPSSEPSGPNLGIGGSLTGSLTAAGKSDFWVHQLGVASSTTAGASMTITWQWDEVI